MKSPDAAVSAAAPITPQDLPRWVPGEILSSSDAQAWSGVTFRAYRYQGQDVEIPPMRDFLLVAYQIGVTPMQRRFDGRWSRETCGPGAVSLLTRSQGSHWNWSADVDVSHVYLTAELVSGIAREVTGRAIEDIRLRDILRTDDPVIGMAVEAIAAEAAGHGIGSAMYVEAVTRQLVIHLLRKYANVSVLPMERTGKMSLTQQQLITEFIESSLAENLDLNTLAAQVNQGACSFARHFKRSMGMPPYAYVMQRRVERARQMLGGTSRSLKQIAGDCGYSDQAHLTRLFVRQFGLTPSAYRRQVSGKASSTDSVHPTAI